MPFITFFYSLLYVIKPSFRNGIYYYGILLCGELIPSFHLKRLSHFRA